MKRMARGRVETTPSEQLVALRKARDHYVALADHLKDNPNFVTTRLEDRQRERDARRIAKAYDKSIINMAANMVRAGRPSRTASFFNNLGMARPFFAGAVGLVALGALLYSGALKTPHAGTPAAPPAHEAPLLTASPSSSSSTTGSRASANAANSMPHRAPTALRPTAVADHLRPSAKPAKISGMAAKPLASNDEGFVTKVLQPDGSLKEVHFPAASH